MVVAQKSAESPAKPTYKDCERRVVQLLAGNDAKIRRTGLRKFKILLKKRPNECAEAMSAYWKGLHFCMWMCDKPIPQEDLAEEFGQLLKNGIPSSALNCQKAFISAFFETEAREWFAVDQWRLDKYQMLVRRFFRYCLTWLAERQWPVDDVNWLLVDVIQKFIFQSPHLCLGLQFFMVEMMLDEFKSHFGDGDNHNLETFAESLVKMFFKEAAQTKEPRMLSQFCKEVFDQFILGFVASMEERAEDETAYWPFPISLKRLSELLFTEASSPDCPVRNRRRLYGYVKRFEDIAAASQSDLDDNFWQKIAKRPGSMTLRLEAWAAPRKRSGPAATENKVSENEVVQDDSSPKKKLKHSDDNKTTKDSAALNHEKGNKREKKAIETIEEVKKKEPPAKTTTTTTKNSKETAAKPTEPTPVERRQPAVAPLWTKRNQKEPAQVRRGETLPAYLTLEVEKPDTKNKPGNNNKNEKEFAEEKEKEAFEKANVEHLEKFVADPPAFFKGAVGKAVKNRNFRNGGKQQKQNKV